MTGFRMKEKRSWLAEEKARKKINLDNKNE